MSLQRRLPGRILHVLAHWAAPCQRVAQLLSESRDRKLSVREKVTVSSHLLICDWCTRFGRQITTIDRAASTAGDHPEKLAGQESGLSETAKSRIRQKLRFEQ